MVRVLIVDDSSIIRQTLQTRLKEFSGIEVVGTAADPYAARDKLVRLKPDAMTLDVEMPRMDGITFLRKVMKFFPLPVIMLSSVTAKGSAHALEALEIGAFDVLCKPGSGMKMDEVIPILARQLLATENSRFRLMLDRQRQAEESAQSSSISATPSASAKSLHTGSVQQASLGGGSWHPNSIIALGASTGGTKALEEVLIRLPAHCPPIVFCQHMPAGFTAPFAQRLNSICQVEVKEGASGEALQPGTAYLAPGDQHMEIHRSGGVFRIQLNQGERIHYQRPAVEPLFQSLAEINPKHTVAAILTGMGADGARGLLDLKMAGAYTIAQNEETSVVWGMPGAAVRLNAACKILPLHQIAQGLLNNIKKR